MLVVDLTEDDGPSSSKRSSNVLPIVELETPMKCRRLIDESQPSTSYISNVEKTDKTSHASRTPTTTTTHGYTSHDPGYDEHEVRRYVHTSLTDIPQGDIETDVEIGVGMSLAEHDRINLEQMYGKGVDWDMPEDLITKGLPAEWLRPHFYKALQIDKFFYTSYDDLPMDWLVPEHDSQVVCWCKPYI